MWSGLGINYNYDGAGYDYQNDLALIKSVGFTKVRLLIENWNYSAGIALWKTIAQYALTLGFEEVTFGLTFQNYNAAEQTAFAAAQDALANWFDQQTVPVGTTFIFCQGNEESFHITDSSTTAQVRAFYRTRYTALKAAHPLRTFTYSMANGEMFPFFNDLNGSALAYPWDYASVNLYSYPTGQTSGTYFRINIGSMLAWFGTTVEITEFGPDDGGYLDTEWFDRHFYADQFLQNLHTIIDNNLPAAYIYNFQDSLFGCLSPKRIFRSWWYVLRGVREPFNLEMK